MKLAASLLLKCTKSCYVLDCTFRSQTDLIHMKVNMRSSSLIQSYKSTVKILKIGTPEIITIIVLQLEQLDFTVQYCVQKMQTE